MRSLRTSCTGKDASPADDSPLVLIVDDNALNAKLSQGMLSAGGYQTVVARDGGHGLELAKTLLPALVLADLQMPGMDGLELTRQLKRDIVTAAIPVIALTAHAMSQHRDQAMAAGCCGYLTKPIRYRLLLAEVAKVLARPVSGAH